MASALTTDIGYLYKTRGPVTSREDADVKYFLWVKQGQCGGCTKEYDLFPGYVLAEAVRHPSWVLICPHCGDLNEVANPDIPGKCKCGTSLLRDGPVRRNKCACPHCGHINTSPFRVEGVPKHRLFAIEYHNDAIRDRRGRLFKKPDADDLVRVDSAQERWKKARAKFVPDDSIAEGDESSGLRRWGYRHWSELFNARQLLGLEHAARLVAAQPSERLRKALATNFSDLLRYQNMVCRYDTMALKSLDIFSIHGFPVGYVQVESNMLGLRTRGGIPVGSGGWANIIDKYTKAKRYCTDPFEVLVDGKKKMRVPIVGEWIGERHPQDAQQRERSIDIRCASSTSVELPGQSLDTVFTDPPYFGMVQYGELMQFCYVWLRRLMGNEANYLNRESAVHVDELTGNHTAERDLAHFTEGLARVYRRMAHALKPGAPLVFTYHHNTQAAYGAAGVAILDAGLTCSASLPCPAEMSGSIHIHGTQSSIVDTVFVCRDRGTTPRSWLFDSSEELATIVVSELGELRSAGLKPSAGDIRCIVYGHLTRMAVWSLRPSWSDKLPTTEKISRFKLAMDSLASLDAVRNCLSRTSPAPIESEMPLYQLPKARYGIHLRRRVSPPSGLAKLAMLIG